MKTTALHSVSAKSIALVVTLIGLSVAACAGLMIGHFKTFNRALEMERLQQNVAAAKLLLNPYNDQYAVVNDMLVLGGHVLNCDTYSVDMLSKTFGGVATVFQGDTRVTTNILKPDGTRATGTRLEPGPVFDTVLKQGRQYVGTASVLGKRYVTAYDPIKGSDGKVLGILMIGVEEGVADRAIDKAISMAIAFGLGLALIGAAVGWFAFHRMLRPFGPLGQMMEDAARGEFSDDVPFTWKKDEFGTLARIIRLFGQTMKQQEALRLQNEAAKAEAEKARLRAESAAKEQAEALVVSTFGRGLKALAEENLSFRLEADVPAAYVRLRDDFNTAIATSQHNAQERERMAAVREAERAAASAARKKAEAETQAKAVALVVSSFGAGLSALAGRDLTARIDGQLPQDYLSLKDDFNRTGEQLEAAMNDIHERIVDIAASTDEVQKSALNMAERSERQASRLEESAAAVSQITASAEQAARNADAADAKAIAAQTNAENGAKIASQTADAMRRIAATSNEMADILGTIEEISFQTNLLALNAGVEAARAGAAGRGFAVVASEVRILAGRSSEASRRIKRLIADNAAGIETGVKLTEENGEALGRIATDVHSICTLMNDIAAAQKDQLRALREIDGAVAEMDRDTQANAAMAQQNHALSESLAEFTRALETLAAGFKTTTNDRRSAMDSPSQTANVMAFPRRSAAERTMPPAYVG